jgi:HD-GYP domain-containing protein (c-di-GMP phosphodiesterase class II)
LIAAADVFHAAAVPRPYRPSVKPWPDLAVDLKRDGEWKLDRDLVGMMLNEKGTLLRQLQELRRQWLEDMETTERGTTRFLCLPDELPGRPCREGTRGHGTDS